MQWSVPFRVLTPSQCSGRFLALQRPRPPPLSKRCFATCLSATAVRAFSGLDSLASLGQVSRPPASPTTTPFQAVLRNLFNCRPNGQAFAARWLRRQISKRCFATLFNAALNRASLRRKVASAAAYGQQPFNTTPAILYNGCCPPATKRWSPASFGLPSRPFYLHTRAILVRQAPILVNCRPNGQAFAARWLRRQIH